MGRDLLGSLLLKAFDGQFKNNRHRNHFPSLELRSLNPIFHNGCTSMRARNTLRLGIPSVV